MTLEILADRIEHDRTAEFGRDLAHDGDRFGFEATKMRRARVLRPERFDKIRHGQSYAELTAGHPH